MNAPHRYKLLWKVVMPEKPMTKEELEASNSDFAASDALFAVSIIYPPDGSLSTLMMGFDGRREGPGHTPAELPDEEWFKIWGLLALRLTQSATLGEYQKLLCLRVHEAIRDAIMSARRREEGPKH